jgi:hypothetical protein
MKWGIIFHGVYNAILIIPAVYFYEVWEIDIVRPYGTLA